MMNINLIPPYLKYIIYVMRNQLFLINYYPILLYSCDGIETGLPNNQTVMQNSTIDDLADAYEGYVLFHGVGKGQKDLPSKEFMQEMIERFPDM